MANLVYSVAKANLNTVNWATAGNKFRVLLATAAYTPAASDVFVSNVVADETTGTGYVRKLLASKARVADGDNYEYQAAAVAWTLLTSDFKWAIVYYDVNGSDASDATAWLVCALDLGSQSIVAALFTLNFGGANPGAVFEIQ